MLATNVFRQLIASLLERGFPRSFSTNASGRLDDLPLQRSSAPCTSQGSEQGQHRSQRRRHPINLRIWSFGMKHQSIYQNLRSKYHSCQYYIHSLIITIRVSLSQSNQRIQCWYLKYISLYTVVILYTTSI